MRYIPICCLAFFFFSFETGSKYVALAQVSPELLNLGAGFLLQPFESLCNIFEMGLHLVHTSSEVSCGIFHLWPHVGTPVLWIFKHFRLGNLKLYSYHFNLSQCQTTLRFLCAWSHLPPIIIPCIVYCRKEETGGHCGHRTHPRGSHQYIQGMWIKAVPYSWPMQPSLNNTVSCLGWQNPTGYSTGQHTSVFLTARLGQATTA